MCGIAGFTGTCDPQILTQFQSALHHRGPDERGKYWNSSIALASTRLAIIDLAHGQQPIFNEDKSCAIVFNGEIYNYRELREDLKRRHRFLTDGDTEVILHLYEEKGTDTPRYLRGDFAFCIWDSRNKSCFLSRDHLGVKPLFYSLTASGDIVFSSELTALLLHPAVQPDFDLDAVAEYFASMYVSAPRTLFRGVRKLQPGESLVWKNRTIEILKYWRMPEVEVRDVQPAAIHEQALNLLRTAVRRRLAADVPVGAFLSGGLDSSLIVALASEQERGLHTFSVGYGDPDFDELDYARQVSRRYGTNHHEFVIHPEAEILIEEVIAATDEPIADSSAIPTYLVARETRKHVKVALSGIGGDELFFGYPRYLGAKLSELLPDLLRGPVSGFSQLWSSQPTGRDIGGWIRRFGSGLDLSLEEQYRLWTMFVNPAVRQSLLGPGLRSPGYAEEEVSALFRSINGGALDRIFRLDVARYLAFDLLPLCDNMSMAQSLEVRVPFCDIDLVEGMARIPASSRFPGYRLKPVLKSIAREFLPRDIVSRKKQGFMAPIGRWFRNELKSYVEAQLRPENLPGFLNPVAVRNLVNEHTSGNVNNTQTVWALLLLTLWCAKIRRLRSTPCKILTQGGS